MFIPLFSSSEVSLHLHCVEKMNKQSLYIFYNVITFIILLLLFLILMLHLCSYLSFKLSVLRNVQPKKKLELIIQTHKDGYLKRRSRITSQVSQAVCEKYRTRNAFWPYFLNSVSFYYYNIVY